MFLKNNTRLSKYQEEYLDILEKEINYIESTDNFLSESEQDFLLNEAYFGKDEKLLEIEDIFRELQQSYHADRKQEITYFSPKIKRIEEILQEKFNIKYVFLNYLSLAGSHTLFLSSLNTLFHINSNYILTDKELKFKNEFPFILISMDLPNLLQTLQPDEILAILLHEVGHNFKINSITSVGINIAQLIIFNILILVQFLPFIISTTVGKLSFLSKPIDLLLTYISRIFKIIYEGVDNKFPQFLYIFSSIIKILSTILSVARIPQAMFMKFTNLFQIMYNSLIGGSITHEKYSDNFATSLGYGNSLISALEKMTTKSTPIYIKNKEDENLNLIISTYIDFLISAVTGMSHPNNANRLKDQIKYLKDELDRNNVDSKKKSEILNEINKLENLYSDKIITSLADKQGISKEEFKKQFNKEANEIQKDSEYFMELRKKFDFLVDLTLPINEILDDVSAKIYKLDKDLLYK
jgi:hypothetical protein